MICFDSDFIIDFLRGKKEAINKVKEFEEEGRELITTAINSLEIYVGIMTIDKLKSQRVIKTNEFLNSILILPFTKEASEKAALLLNSLKKKGTPIGLKDTLIAAIAINNDIPLLTRNLKHFNKIENLKIETW